MSSSSKRSSSPSSALVMLLLLPRHRPSAGACLPPGRDKETGGQKEALLIDGQARRHQAGRPTRTTPREQTHIDQHTQRRTRSHEALENPQRLQKLKRQTGTEQ